jgi:branched-chain amino acid transport system permease protein
MQKRFGGWLLTIPPKQNSKEIEMEAFVLNQMFSGLVRGALYFLVTSGLTLLFGVVGTLNMAHFSLYMIAAYVTWSFSTLMQQGSAITFFSAVLLAVLVMSLFAFVIEWFIIKYLYERIMTEQLMVTFAMIYILDDVSKLIWGPVPRFLAKPDILTQMLSIGENVQFPLSGLFVIIVGILTGTGVWLLLKKTRLGRILRAACSFKEMVSALGFPISRIYTAMFVLSVLLASIAGASWALIGSVDPGIGSSLLIEGFCVMVIGGMGSFPGTALSALICGLAYSFAIVVFPKLATLLLFIFAGVVLVVRPWGLMGVKGRLH